MDAESKKEEESSKKIIHTYPLIRMCDMADEMRGETMELCVTACEKHAANNELAARMIKENMDKRFGPSWHAVVGEGYGFEISYEFTCTTRMGTFTRVLFSSLIHFLPFLGLQEYRKNYSLVIFISGFIVFLYLKTGYFWKKNQIGISKNSNP